MSDEMLKVAMCQVETKQWSVEGNLAATLVQLDEAAAMEADIAVTPECVLHGYGKADTSEELREKLDGIAETVDGPSISKIREKTVELGLHTLVGFVEQGEDDKLHNSAALIAPDGSILDLYRKVHCRPFESIEHDGCFTPGEDFKVVKLKIRDMEVACGTMIGFDREIPEAVRCLRSLGAEVVLCPLATSTSDMFIVPEKAHNELITQARAAENELCIVVVNHSGVYNGGSFAIGPHGQAVEQMGEDAGVMLIELAISEVREEYQENALGWMGWGHRRQSVYEKYIS